MGTTKFRGKVQATEGFIGEVNTLVFSFQSLSSAQTGYVIVPFTGTVTSAYVANAVAARTAAYTVKIGSAGDTVASVTTSSATNAIAGQVTVMTLGTVAVTAGQSLSVARGTQGSVGEATVQIQVTKTV